MTQATSGGWARLKADAARWVRPEQIGDPDEITRSILCKLLFRHPALRAMAWFRLGSALQARGVRGVPHWTERRLRRLYGLEIPVGAAVGGGLYVAHPVGCVLVADSIGENVTVIAQVTFGMRDSPEWPTIGDRTFFGAGAGVLGPITIGADAKVGANAVVLANVEAGSTVVGVPARPVG